MVLCFVPRIVFLDEAARVTLAENGCAAADPGISMSDCGWYRSECSRYTNSDWSPVRRNVRAARCGCTRGRWRRGGRTHTSRCQRKPRR